MAAFHLRVSFPFVLMLGDNIYEGRMPPSE